ARGKKEGEVKRKGEKVKDAGASQKEHNLAWPLITVQGPLTVLQREHGPPPGRSLSPGDDCRNT
ncbi:hypothetical protein JOQ06_005934, partial [Pogonophryne albipinna]